MHCGPGMRFTFLLFFGLFDSSVDALRAGDAFYFFDISSFVWQQCRCTAGRGCVLLFCYFLVCLTAIQMQCGQGMRFAFLLFFGLFDSNLDALRAGDAFYFSDISWFVWQRCRCTADQDAFYFFDISWFVWLSIDAMRAGMRFTFLILPGLFDSNVDAMRAGMCFAFLIFTGLFATV